MKKSHFPIIIEQDINGVFIVECPIFKACRTYGNNLNEALENIQEVIAMCVEERTEEFDSENTFIGVRDIEIAI